MIRTAISFLALFGSLFLVSKALTESQLQHKDQCVAHSKVTKNLFVTGTDACCGDELPAAGAETHPLSLVSLPNDMKLLPTTPQSYLPTEESSTELADPSVTPVVLEETSRRTAPQKTVVLPLITSGEDDGSDDIQEKQSEFDNDRPIGSGLRDEATEDAIAEESASVEEELLRSVPGDELDIQPIDADAEEADADEGLQDNELNESDVADELATAGQADEADGEPKLNHEEEVNVEQQAPAPEPQAELLSPEMAALRQKVRDVLAYHIERPEAVEQRSPWGIMHALIAYGVDTEVTQGGRRVNAIGWMCFNGPCRGQQLLYVENDRLRTRQGPGVQGHEGQYLAMLAQSKVKLDFPIRIEGHEFQVADLVEYEKRTCVEDTELTFKLIGLSHYLALLREYRRPQSA